MGIRAVRWARTCGGPHKFGLLAIVPMTTGCFNLPAVSAGQVGAETTLLLSTTRAIFRVTGTRTWGAECHGRRFFCSAHGGRRGSTSQVSCKREATAPGGEVVGSVVEGPADEPKQDPTLVCNAAFAHVSDFATFWATRSPGARGLDELPQRADFVAVCRSMPENAQRCMQFRRGHSKVCESVASRLGPGSGRSRRPVPGGRA